MTEQPKAAVPRVEVGTVGGARLLDCAILGATYYYFTSAIVLLGVVFGQRYLTPARDLAPADQDIVSRLCNWDGRWYEIIVDHGYAYRADGKSSVAFFPLFPLLAKGLQAITGWPTRWCLVVVAHACLLAAFMVAAAYFQERFADHPRRAEYALLALGLYPVGFFFRMGYSESLFLLLCGLTLLGLSRRRPLIIVALIVGLATASRPVGVALAVPLALELWQRRTSWRGFLGQAAVILPLAFWGLAAYMAYLWHEFNEPLAFAVAQSHWQIPPRLDAGEKFVALITLEPLWTVYDSASPCCWQQTARGESPLFSLAFANPLYFGVMALVIALGAWKRWLTRQEWLLSATLLLIPYLTRAQEFCMNSQGRFTIVILPTYLVFGRLLMALPAMFASILLAIAAVGLFTYAAFFGLYYEFI